MQDLDIRLMMARKVISLPKLTTVVSVFSFLSQPKYHFLTETYLNFPHRIRSVNFIRSTLNNWCLYTYLRVCLINIHALY